MHVYRRPLCGALPSFVSAANGTVVADGCRRRRRVDAGGSGGHAALRAVGGVGSGVDFRCGNGNPNPNPNLNPALTLTLT